MRESNGSRTALRVAMRRAAHQVLDHPTVFDDPYALSILGDEIAAKIRSENSLGSPTLRAFVAVRSRYAEDQLGLAVEAGVRQYVELGAGYDTFAYRSPHPGLRVFEVDHPATQAHKLTRLEAAGIAIPDSLTFVGIDFEQQNLDSVLTASGFRHDLPAFYSWLGVVPYLTRAAFEDTLRFIVSMPEGSGVVFDYSADPSSLPPRERQAFDKLAARAASAGEPFQLFIGTEELTSLLRSIGFSELENLGARELNERYFIGRKDSLRIAGNFGHLMNARV